MRTAMFFFACVLLAIPCSARIITVAKDGSGDFDNIQAGIDHSWDGDTVVVSPGTYTENIYFNGAAITVTSTDPNDRDVVESTIITANSGYSVNFDFFEDGNSIITGFTVVNAGIYCEDSSPVISKNIIDDCKNGGIYSPLTNYPNTVIYEDSYPTISHNEITGNSMRAVSRCHGKISNNIISGNHGGGLLQCNGVIENNIISGNISYANEGVLFYCDGTIINNTIVGNKALGLGGGLWNCNGIVKNNIICLNKGWGIASYCQNSFNNVWGNTPGNFSEGASPGTGDIRFNPLFIVDGFWDANNVWVDGDYHLLSQAGRWDANSQSWVLDNWTSHCIDAGDPCDAIGVEPNPNGGRINMGAYGGTSEASKSPSGVIEPVCTKYPTMDFNRDCKVDFKDFAPMAENWLECNLDPPEACWE